MAFRLDSWWNSMPLVTKSYGAACVLTTLAIHLDFVTPLQVYLNFDSVISKLEVWRLLTNFFYIGPFGLGYVFHIFFLVRHAQMLEEGNYRGRTADFIFFILFGACLLLGVDFLFWRMRWMHIYPIFLGPSLVFMIVYVWARRNPYMRMSLFGLFTFSAPYLPWVILGLESMFDKHGIVTDLLGIAVGHLYFFLDDTYPKLTERRILRTPHLLKLIFDPIDVAHQQQQQQQQQAQPDPAQPH